MNIRAIIIEDEEPARNLIKNYLKNYLDISLEGEFADGFNGVKAINEIKPDLVFLDIQMPKLTGFEVLELMEHKPLVIFTTAYDQFAIKAFESNAVDYLLKPFSRERFAQAIGKAIEKYRTVKTDEKVISSVLQSMDEKPEYLERIAVKSNSKVNVIPVDSIIYLEAEGDYVKIYTKETRFLKEKTMKYFDSHLEPKQFVRIHRSYIVNVNEINKLEYYDKENYVVFLKNNVQLRASTSGYKLLKKILNL
jgi:two-component system, LytTR family, response regulator